MVGRAAGGRDRAEGALARRGRRGRPRTHRTRRSAAERVRHGDRGPRARRGASGGGPGDARGAARAPPRRAVLGEGHARHRGRPDHPRRPPLRGAGAEGGRRGGRAAPRGRRDPRGEDDHARVRPQGRDRQRALRRHPESVGVGVHLRRVERRRGGGGGHRHGAARDRDRRGRVDPHPGELLRRRRAQAHVRADPAGAGRGRGAAHPPGPPLPDGRGRRALPLGHGGPRRSGRLVRAGRAPGLHAGAPAAADGDSASPGARGSATPPRTRRWCG